MTPRPTSSALGLAAALAATAYAPAQTDSAPTLEDRLDRLVERLEERRVLHHIPGMAIAVVKDDAVVLSRGFGLADVENDVPVTDRTIFAVGSTTKAFTATLLGMVIDDGHLHWDDPVRKHLPKYRLSDPAADAKVQVRDLLCHRTGLAAMNLLWYGNDVTPEQVLAASWRAEMLHPFREHFGYSNINYLAAGEVTSRASGEGWEPLLDVRLLKPLGMRDTHLSIDQLGEDPNGARGYRWNADTESLEHQALRSVDAVAPAGAINSNVRDMSQWVRFQLRRGAIGDRRLLSEAQHAETWTPHITVADGVDYGLGWFLRTWEGQRVVDHAGGIDGFTAEVALLPDENIGFVLLMNLFASPLQEASRQIVFETLLGPWSSEVETPKPAAGAHDAFVGTYLGNFGSFKDAKFEVLVQNGALAIDVPGQMVYELRPPDAEGKRRFDITDQVAVRFNSADDGSVRSLSMFQAGLEFELPREGVAAAAADALDAATVRDYLGRYRLEALGVDARVLVQNNRLAVDVPGQMIFELHPPDAEDRWLFRVKNTLWVRFNRDEAGAVASMTLSQEGVPMELPRLAGGDDGEALPTGVELMQMVHQAIGATAPNSHNAFRATGRVRFPHIGIDGTAHILVGPGGRLREELDLGPFGRMVTLLDGARGWHDSPVFRELELTGATLAQARLQHPSTWSGDWREHFEIGSVQSDEFDGTPVHVVKLEPAEGSSIDLMVDATTHLPVARRFMAESPLGQAYQAVVRFDDYRDVGGMTVPHRIESRNEMTGSVVVELDTITTEPTIDDDAWTLRRNP